MGPGTRVGAGYAKRFIPCLDLGRSHREAARAIVGNSFCATWVFAYHLECLKIENQLGT